MHAAPARVLRSRLEKSTCGARAKHTPFAMPVHCVEICLAGADASMFILMGLGKQSATMS